MYRTLDMWVLCYFWNTGYVNAYESLVIETSKTFWGKKKNGSRTLSMYHKYSHIHYLAVKNETQTLSHHIKMEIK